MRPCMQIGNGFAAGNFLNRAKARAACTLRKSKLLAETNDRCFCKWHTYAKLNDHSNAEFRLGSSLIATAGTDAGVETFSLSSRPTRKWLPNDGLENSCTTTTYTALII